MALIAQYSTGPAQSRSLSEYALRLSDSGFLPVVIGTTDCSEELRFPFGLPDRSLVLRRDNVGYDFGSWASALRFLPGVRACPTVLLTNDAQLGPFAPISHLLDWACAPGPDIRGLTSSYQFHRHLQSYFVAFRGGILEDRAWREFFDGVRPERDKETIVMKYELGMSRLAFREAYSWQEYFNPLEVDLEGENPTTVGWRSLLEYGIPFVKKTVLAHPSLEDEAAAARRFVKERFHTDIDTW